MDTVIILYSTIVLIAAIFGFFIGAAWGINKSGMRVYNDMKELAQSYNRAYGELVNTHQYEQARKPLTINEREFFKPETSEEIDYDTAMAGGTLG